MPWTLMGSAARPIVLAGKDDSPCSKQQFIRDCSGRCEWSFPLDAFCFLYLSYPHGHVARRSRSVFSNRIVLTTNTVCIEGSTNESRNGAGQPVTTLELPACPMGR